MLHHGSECVQQHLREPVAIEGGLYIAVRMS